MRQDSDRPIVGMLCWEAGKVLRGLEQLAELPGNATHPKSFPFPLRYERIEGACFETIVARSDPGVRDRMIAASRRMEQEGIRLITTSCGFNAILQPALAAAVEIPVITSALLHVPGLLRILPPARRIGVLTAQKGALKTEHLRAVGITESDQPRLAIAGIEHTSQWRRIHEDPEAPLDLPLFRRELSEVVEELLSSERNLGALVLECTDLPPFAPEIRRRSGLPVFDIISLVIMAFAASSGRPAPLSNGQEKLR